MTQGRYWAKLTVKSPDKRTPETVLCSEPLVAETLDEAEVEALTLRGEACCRGADRIVVANDLGEDLRVVPSRQ